MKITGYIFAALLVFLGSAPAFSQAQDDRLILGLPPFVGNQYIEKMYQPLLDHIEASGLFEIELKPLGETYEDFLINLATQRYDLLVIPGHWALPIIEKMNYQPLLRSRREFGALVFAHENSGINTLADLKGSKVTTLNGLSLAASVLRRVMQVQGINPEKHIEILEQETLEQVLTMVRAEKAQAGVIVEMFENQYDEEITGKLKLVSKLSAGPAVILAGEHFSEQQRDLVVQFMLGFENTDDAEKVPEVASFEGFLLLDKNDLERFRESEASLGQFIPPSGQ